MRNYDFHQLMSPETFQKFAASILKARENKNVKSNSLGQDGGIDIYSLDEKIIGQVKNYKNDANKVIASLKKEVERVKKINPENYFIITSATIRNDKRKILLSMFEGYLKAENIIDKNDLNELLTEPEYHHLEVEYLNLLVPNSFVLSHYLSDVVNKNVYTKTEVELNNINNDKKIFSVNEVFFDTLEKLFENKTVIITGEPGIGKSTMARMLCLYLINQNPEIEFMSVNSVEELFKIYNKDKSQVYFFDDFWGDFKYNFQISEKEKENLINFIDYLKEDKNKWLIITTREYILKDGVKLNKKIQDKYNLYKYTISLKETSKEAKFNILFNHINNTHLEWKHLRVLLHNWEMIVNIDNYNPRYIAIFFSNYEKYKDKSAPEFLSLFVNYLRNPFEFWEDTLNNQPLEVIILLMIIALNNKELTLKDLNKKYNNIINLKSPNDKLMNFNELIKRMDNEFITKLVCKDDEIKINFKNPSYKEFIYEYLKNNFAFYISYLYNDYLEIDELVNLWRVINKDFELFKDLEDTKKIDQNIVDYLGKKVINDIFYSLIELTEVTDFDYPSLIKDYIINFMESSLEDLEDVIYNSKYYQLIFIMLKPLSLKYDLSQYMRSALLDIIFTSEGLYEFEKISIIKELYPEIYKDVYKEYHYDIRSNLINCIRDDAFYYFRKEDLDSLEILRFEDVPKIYKELQLNISKKLIDELDDLFKKLEDESAKDIDENIDFEKYKNPNPENKNKEIENFSEIEQKIEKLIGKSIIVQDEEELFKKWRVTPKIKKTISKLEDNQLLSTLTQNTDSLYWLCQYFMNNKYQEDEIIFLQNFVNYLITESNLTQNEVEDFATMIFAEEKLIFKIEDIDNKYASKEKYLNSSLFIKRGEWYCIVHPLIYYYFILSNLKKYLKNIINVETVVYKLIDEKYDWKSLGFVNYGSETTVRLIKEIFSEKWNKEVRIPLYKDYTKGLKNSNSVAIAKAMLKPFELTFEYDYFGFGSVVHGNVLLWHLLNIDFNFDICNFFFISDDIDEQLNNYLLNFAESGEVFDVNRCLRKKTFITILKESGIVDTLNDLYQKIIKIIENDECN